MSDWSSFKKDKELSDAWRSFLAEKEERISSNDIIAEANWVQGLKSAGNVAKKIGGLALDIVTLPVRIAYSIDHMSPQRFASAVGLRDTVKVSTPGSYTKGGREAANRARSVREEMLEAEKEFKAQAKLSKNLEKQINDAGAPELKEIFAAFATELGEFSKEINSENTSAVSEQQTRNLSDRLRSMVANYEKSQDQRAARGIEQKKVQQIDNALKEKRTQLIQAVEQLNLDESAKKKALAKVDQFIKTNRLMMLSQVKSASLKLKAKQKLEAFDKPAKKPETEPEPEETAEPEPESEPEETAGSDELVVNSANIIRKVKEDLGDEFVPRMEKVIVVILKNLREINDNELITFKIQEDTETTKESMDVGKTYKSVEKLLGPKNSAVLDQKLMKAVLRAIVATSGVKASDFTYNGARLKDKAFEEEPKSEEEIKAEKAMLLDYEKMLDDDARIRIDADGKRWRNKPMGPQVVKWAKQHPDADTVELIGAVFSSEKNLKVFENIAERTGLTLYQLRKVLEMKFDREKEKLASSTDDDRSLNEQKTLNHWKLLAGIK